MSIYDIKISEITSQYLAVIRELEAQNIEVAQEFMVLAATLIEIKSKMILPRNAESLEAVLEEDPRDDLVQRILEYKRFKALAEELKMREEQNQRIFRKPQEDISCYLDNPDEYLSLDFAQFVNAFNLFIDKKQRVEAVKRHYTKIERERTTMISRIGMILKKIRANQGKDFSFKEFVPEGADRYDTVVSFMSVLEMAKDNVISVDQQHNYGDITIKAGAKIDENEIFEKYREASEMN